MRDRAQTREDLEQRIFTLTVTNVHRYYGYDLYTVAGTTKNKLQYDDPFRRPEEVDGIEFFIRALVGFTDFGRVL